MTLWGVGRAGVRREEEPQRGDSARRWQNQRSQSGNPDGCVLKCSLGGITGAGTGRRPGTCGKNPAGGAHVGAASL